MKSIYNVKIIENKAIANGIYSLLLESFDISRASFAGQFISIYIDDGIHLLGRPLSICEILGFGLRIVYRIEGEGTKILSKKTSGDIIRILGPLGNGFSIEKKEKYAIFGAGIGAPPMLELSKQIRNSYKDAYIDIYLGFRNADSIILEEEFKKYGSVFISTDDGSRGKEGNILSSIKNEEYDIAYACGPNAMLKAISDKFCNIECYISLEERMACTVGVCLACVVKNSDGGLSRICVDGPVFISKEVLL